MADGRPDNRPAKRPDAISSGAFWVPMELNLDDLAEMFSRPRVGDRWGAWVYAANRALVHERRKWEVDLDRMVNAAAVLDWIMQAAAKDMVTRADVGDLVFAIDYCLGGLQERFCGGALSTRAPDHGLSDDSTTIMRTESP
jgi:hypothetical protein